MAFHIAGQYWNTPEDQHRSMRSLKPQSQHFSVVKILWHIGHNYGMRLDHISYVTTHDQIADTAHRLGSRLGITFIDGGIHPRFGTRNFTSALRNNQYIEVVCPLNHPATEQTPWGLAVSKKADEGGGWFTWVFSTDDLSQIAKKFGREPIDGHRTLPNGSDLKWKQIGVRDIFNSPELPFFIEWLSADHPSQHGDDSVEIVKIKLAGNHQLNNSWFESEIYSALKGLAIEWITPSENEGTSGLVEVELLTPNGLVTLK